MLYHYYGSKEGLFNAVLERMYETLRAGQRDFAIRGSDPVEAMRCLRLNPSDGVEVIA
jgi:TetR/AcrR family transcriptional regulator